LCCRDYFGATFLPNDEGVFDYIAVDGRSRVNCIKRALPLLKPEVRHRACPKTHCLKSLTVPLCRTATQFAASARDQGVAGFQLD